MKKLIKMNIYELEHNNLSFIMIGVSILFAVIYGPSCIEDNRFNLPEGGYEVFNNMFYDLTALLIIIGIFTAIILGQSFKDRTIINKVVIKSRKDILFSKAVINITFSSCCALLYPVVGSIIVTVKYGWNSLDSNSFFQAFKILLSSFFVICALFSIVFMISIIFRNNIKTLVYSFVFLFGSALLFSFARALGIPKIFLPYSVIRCIVEKNMIFDCLIYIIYSLVIIGFSLGISQKIFAKCELK